MLIEGVSNVIESENEKELAVLCYFNKYIHEITFRGFVNIFDGNYKDAIENFRKVQMYKP